MPRGWRQDLFSAGSAESRAEPSTPLTWRALRGPAGEKVVCWNCENKWRPWKETCRQHAGAARLSGPCPGEGRAGLGSALLRSPPPFFPCFHPNAALGP